MKLKLAAWAALPVAVLLSAAPADAQCPKDNKKGIYGTVTTMDGEPVPGMAIHLKKNIDKELRPLMVETTKKGRFTYPRVELFTDGYLLSIDSEEYFIRHFHFCVRRGNGELWQDDEASLTPQQQSLIPHIRHRGANTQIFLKLQKLDEFEPPKTASKAATTKSGADAATPPPRELTTREKAEEALALGDLKAAAGLFAEAIQETPEDADLRWQRAAVLANAGDTDAALVEAREVLRIDPAKSGVRVEMAQWLKAAGRLGEAVPILEEERAQATDDTRVFRLLVSAYREQGDDGKVRETLDAWAGVDPDEPEVLLELARLAAADQDFTKSSELYAKLAEKDPENADRMFVNVGISILNQPAVSDADRRSAIEAFKKGLEVNPDYARAHVELGYALLGLGELNDARHHFERFVEIAPSDSRVSEVKGVLSALPR